MRQLVHFTIFLSKQAGHRLKKGFGCIWKYVGHQSALNSGLNFINLVLLMFEVLCSHAKNLHSKKWAGNGFWTWSRGRWFGSQVFNTFGMWDTPIQSSPPLVIQPSAKNVEFCIRFVFFRLVKRSNLLQISHHPESGPIPSSVVSMDTSDCDASSRFGDLGEATGSKSSKFSSGASGSSSKAFSLGSCGKCHRSRTGVGWVDFLFEEIWGALSKTILDSPMNSTLWQTEGRFLRKRSWIWEVERKTRQPTNPKTARYTGATPKLARHTFLC